MELRNTVHAVPNPLCQLAILSCQFKEARSMFTRTKTRIVHFKCPFTLPGLEGTQPAGDYQVKDDEEQITGISWLAYRRVATLIEIAKGSTTSLVAIDNLDLDAAIEKDRGTSITATG
ncbi:hypothetical protein [Allorhizobium ampelinum]|nr:hypothetical protein [Allorhizobium ampelinum]